MANVASPVEKNNLIETVERGQGMVVFLEKEQGNNNLTVQYCKDCGHYFYDSLTNECPKCQYLLHPVDTADLVNNINELNVKLQDVKVKNNEIATAGTIVTMAGGLTLTGILGINMAFLGLIALIGSLGLLAWFNSKRY